MWNSDEQPVLSLVLPVYNEEADLDELYERSRAVLQEYGPYEIVFVNDHSADGSLEKLTALAERDPNVKVIDFSRNFGHQIAITAGIDHARGKAVVVMDSDLQDTPETIRDMVAKWREGFDVVYGKRRARKDTPFKKLSAFLFYRLLKRFANIEIPEDTGDFRLMDQQVAEEMRRLREHSRFMRGMTSWVGFKQTAVLFDREERRHGVTNYPLRKMVKLAFDALTSFSYLPLRFASLLGLAAAGLSLLGILYALARKLFFPAEVVEGWTFTVIIILFIGGVQLLVLGVMGEYLGRIYTESQGRPLYVIRKLHNFESPPREEP